MYLHIYLANLFRYYILYQYMCITLNVYIDSYIMQHHTILLYKYGAIEINKHLQLHFTSLRVTATRLSTVLMSKTCRPRYRSLTYF